MKEEELIEWYAGKQQIYSELTRKCRSKIEEILRNNKVQFCEISYRTKSIDSFEKKIIRKNETNPDNIEDLAGIRVIGFFDVDVEKIKETITNDKSIKVVRIDDKGKKAGADKFGYKAIHVICSFQDSVIDYPELKNLKFEVQIMTILEHAWAQFSHDQSYKLIDIMPEKLVRNLNRQRAFMEILEENFKAIFQEAEEVINDYKIQFKTLLNQREQLFYSLIALKICNELGFNTNFESINYIQNKFFKSDFATELLGRWIVKSDNTWNFLDDAVSNAVEYPQAIKLKIIGSICDTDFLKEIQNKKLMNKFGSFYGKHLCGLHDGPSNGISEVLVQNEDFRAGFGRAVGERFSSLSPDTQKYLLNLAKQFTEFANMLSWGLGLNLPQLSTEMQEEVWKLAESRVDTAHWIVYNFLLYNPLDKVGRNLQHRILMICKRDSKLLNWAAYFFGWHFHLFDASMQDEILSIAEGSIVFCQSLFFLMFSAGKFYTLRESLQEKLWSMASKSEIIAGHFGRYIITGVNFFEDLDEPARNRILVFANKSEGFAKGLGFVFSETILDLPVERQDEVMQLVETNASFAEGFFFHLAYNLKEYLRPFYRRYRKNTGKVINRLIIGDDSQMIPTPIED